MIETDSQSDIVIDTEAINPALWRQWNLEAEERAKSSRNKCAIMPSLDHFTYQDYEHFYEPSDDTYLFLDALQYEFSNNCEKSSEDCEHDDIHLNATIKTTYHNESSSSPLIVCLEVGCGSGVLTVYLQKQWQHLSHHRNVNFQQQNQSPMAIEQKHFRRMYNIVTDINPLALQATQSTFFHNHSHDENVATPITLLECIQCDLATSLLPQLRHSCDVVLFNPPYVPTPDEEVNQTGSIVAAWAGGTNGRIVIDRFIFQLVELLSKRKSTKRTNYDGGVAYIVTVDDNQPYELATLLLKQHQLLMKPLYRRRARNEYLTIQKITWM